MNREDTIVNVRIDEIIPNRFQPRLSFDENELKKLSESIKVHGIIQPLVLRRLNDKYEIVAGERRYKAAVMAGLQTVPAIIVNIDDTKSAEVAVVENIQRHNLTAIEEAYSYQKMLQSGKITQEELASRMGVTQPTIANKLRLLNLTEPVKQALLKNQISERHARSLLGVQDPNTQIAMLNKIISERLTVRQTDEEIARLLGKVPPLEQPPIPNSVSNPTQSPTPVIAPVDTPPVSPVPPVAEAPQPAPVVEKVPSFEQSVETSIPKEVTPSLEPEVKSEAFDVDINSIKNNATDIIPEHKPSDIDMLMRTEAEEETYEQNKSQNKDNKISLEDTAANVDMGSIVSSNMAINPFQDMSSLESFDIPTSATELERPDFDTPSTILTSDNPIINEFMGMKESQTQPQPQGEETKSLSNAINLARSEAKKIESLGFTVETEEFDFEDMYQIIIKIQKD